MQYRVYTLEMNSFTVRVITKQRCVGYMLKFIMCATWVSMSCHLQPCMQSTQMASWLERTERVSWFHNIKSDYSSKKVLTGIWKGTGMVELSF